MPDAFSQPNAFLNYLPKDARMIIKIDAVRVGQKIQWDELVKYKFFEDVMKAIPEDRKDFLKRPGGTGIDLSLGFYAIIHADRKIPTVFYAVPKDTARFAAMVKDVTAGNKIIKVGNGKLVVDRNLAYAWNREIIIITTYDSTKESAKIEGNVSPDLIKTKRLTEACKSLLTKRKTAFQNESLLSLLKQQGDVLIWVDNTMLTQSMQNSKKAETLGIVNNSFLRKGNYTAAVINFERGKVLMETKQYIAKSLDSLYEKYPPKNLSTALVRKLPEGHSIFLCSFNFSPEMLKENLAKAGADKLIDSISKHKAKIEDMLPAIKGDVTMAAMKLDQVAEDDSFTRSLNGIQLFVGGTINDREKFKNLSNLIENKKQDSAKRDTSKKPKPFVLSNDSIFVLSLSPIAGQQFLGSPGANAETVKLISPYKDNPSALIIDLKTIFAFAMQSIAKGKSEEEAKRTSDVLGMFDKLISYGGQHQNGSISSIAELVLTNTEENSLKQFMNLLNLVYTLKSKKSTAYNNE